MDFYMTGRNKDSKSWRLNAAYDCAYIFWMN